MLLDHAFSASRTTPPIVLGMPHLAHAGLSRGFVLRELGHRHWLMLATAAGQAVPTFRDAFGMPVYAAFCAVRLVDAGFAAARENDVLTVRSDLARVSRTQVASSHRLALNGTNVGSVKLVSTFVRRLGNGNHAVARVEQATRAPFGDSELAQTAAMLRQGRLATHRGFDLSVSAARAEIAFDPCPAEDFNGAGFLYFAAFASLVARAEWQAGFRATPPPILELFYRGNLDPGERLVAVLLDTNADTRRWQLRRGSTAGPTLADVFLASPGVPPEPPI